MTATMTRRIVSVVIAAVSVIAVLAGCASTVVGTAMKAGARSGTNANSAEQYPNVLKECDVLTKEDIAKIVGAHSGDIDQIFYGAVCRWQAATPNGLLDITRFWYEQGSLDNERKTAEGLKYLVENRSIVGVRSIVIRPNDPNGGCGVASDADGVVGWWVNPQAPGIDACGPAIKLMAMTLASNA
jgi:Protein of unknown function (DUF3558)